MAAQSVDEAFAARGYQRVERVGEGSHGVVYRARQESVGRDVAIKVLGADWADRPERAARFETEARLVARLEHPHIVPLHDFWVANDRAYLVMRWVQAGTVAQALERGPFREETATRLIEQVAAALDTAHRGGVVHRDLKPANVLLDLDGNAYLTDFGIARDLDTASDGPGGGTPLYMAPEQLAGLAATPQTDVYALGLLAWELLSGNQPWAGQTLEEVVDSQLHAELPALPDVPGAFSDVIRRATSKERGDRYPSAGGFARAVAVAAADKKPQRIEIKASGIPARYSSFVGRQGDLDAVAERMATHRLVTLTGAGGIGKSSLAEEALRSLSDDRPPPVGRVSIESQGPGDLASAVARAFGLEPAADLDPEDVVTAYAAERSLLLLLDGCETLIDEAAKLTARLLQACPDLTIVATSREPLGLAGESVIRVGVLDVDDAVALFAERADLDLDGADTSMRATIRAICEALDGVPLAIELAAARVRSVPLGELAARLDDQVSLLKRSRGLDQRHGSLVGALDWSYELLDPEHQRAFRQFSVFPHGVEWAAAESVLDGELGGDVLARLVDVSLIQAADGNGRHRMLEPIRQYAFFRLNEAGEEAEARLRHAKFFGARSKDAAIQQWTRAVNESRDWIYANRHAIAAAAEWAANNGEPDLAVSITESVGRRLANMGRPELLAGAALQAFPLVGPSRSLAIAMAHIAHSLHILGRAIEADELVDEAESIARQLDDEVALGHVLIRKGGVVSERHQQHAAGAELGLVGIRLLEQANADHFWNEYHNLSLVLARIGRVGEARDASERGHRAWLEATGTESGPFLTMRSHFAGIDGDLAEAADHQRRAAEIMLEAHQYTQAELAWSELSILLLYQGDVSGAAEAFEHVEAIADLLGTESSDFAVQRVWLALAAEDHAAAREAILDWIMRRTGRRPLGGRQVANRMDWLPGNAMQESEFVLLLRLMTVLLLETGETAQACRFVAAAPGLIAQTPFESWEQLGEVGRWRDLEARCPSDADAVAMTLEEAFEEAVAVFGVG